jgi:hypothetical protein
MFCATNDYDSDSKKIDVSYQNGWLSKTVWHNQKYDLKKMWL